jgi:flagellar hook-associated protein 3 FlgL
VRVTHQSIASHVLTGLQGNITRIGETQVKLSSGKQVAKPSDSPTGAASAMSLRSQMAANKQYARNADDGIGWLSTVDSSLTTTVEQISRVRNLALQGMSTGAYGSPENREALASEIDSIRASLIGVANSTYLDRPVFGGTTTGGVAYDPAGTWVGDAGKVERVVGPNTKVQVNTVGTQVFGVGNEQLFKILEDVAADLRNSPGAVGTDINRLDDATRKIQSELSNVGGRYNQVMTMRQSADDAVLNLSKALSDVEDIDLPKTITELQLQQTAYQAALAAGARVVQPSLVEFLR